MYHFNQRSSIRPYSLEKSLGTFKKTDAVLSDHVAREIVAYYRGEEVTPWVIYAYLLPLGVGGTGIPKSNPTKTILTVECTDGLFESSLEVATFARHYELIADLYELDKSLKRVALPFTVGEVEMAMSFAASDTHFTNRAMAIPRACLQFLRPKRTETYLYYRWSEQEMNEDLLRMIGRGLEPETRMHLSRFARAFPDNDLYPIIDWATRTKSLGILHFLLSKKAPSVLLMCLVASGLHQEAVELIKQASFGDECLVVQPDGFNEQWSIGDDHLDGNEPLRRCCWKAMEEINDPTQYRRILASFDIHHKLLGNEEMNVVAPFGVSFVYQSKRGVTAALYRLTQIDSSFTEEMKKQVLADLYPTLLPGQSY